MDDFFTASYSFKNDIRPGETIRCGDKDAYGAISFPVGTSVTFSLDETVNDTEKRWTSKLSDREILLVSESNEDTDGDDMETFSCLNNEEQSNCSNGDESEDDIKSLSSVDPSSEDGEYDDREKLKNDDAHPLTKLLADKIQGRTRSSQLQCRSTRSGRS